MISPEQVLYTAKAHTTGGRDGGASRTSDGHLDIRLSIPGSGGTGTDPEQLFAAGWSACYLSALGLVANKMGVALSDKVAIDAEVDLGPAGAGYALAVRLNVVMPNIDRAIAQPLLHAAHETCPYSRATKGNIEVTTTLI